ncbi:MAG: hypothetical protein ACFCVE_14580 [Phycisphaerae bacterium]
MSQLFVLANQVEAVLWVMLAFVAAVVGVRRPMLRSTLLPMALVLLAFGISDLVETRTGAWYRPWWLLVWKGACVGGLLGLVWRLLRLRRTARTTFS